MTANADEHLASEIDAYVGKLAELDRFAGSVLVARHGHVMISKGYGLANREHDVPNTPATKFRIGSTTKPFTAAAVLMLEEENLLSRKESIRKYFTDAIDAWDPVTIHHLLSHTSGIQNLVYSDRYMETVARSPISVGDLIGLFRDRELAFAPGGSFLYSNPGYILLGRIVELVSGLSFESFLSSRIFQPLGMLDTGIDRPSVVLKGRAAGYSRRSGEWSNAPYLEMDETYSAGNLYSTVEDLLRWDQALYAGQILSLTTLGIAFTPIMNGYGYGWMIGDHSGRRFVTHGGIINGFRAGLTRVPDDGLCIAILANVDTANPDTIRNTILAILFGESYQMPRSRKAVTLPASVYRAMAGRYEVNANYYLTVTFDSGGLMIASNGGTASRIHAETEADFFLPDGDDGFTFIKDEKGDFKDLIYHLGGGEYLHHRA